MRWRNLEPIIQSEVSQKEKHQYGVLTIYMEFRKMINNDPICKTAKETHIKNRFLDYVGKGEGGMIRENSIGTWVLPYVKVQVQCMKHGTKSRHSETTQRDGVEGGVRIGGHMNTHG